MLRSRGQVRAGRHQSSGFTLLELLIVVAVIGVVSAIAVPGILKARISADEAAAVGSLKAVNSAQASYFSSGGNGGYATRLATLATGCPGSTQTFITADLGTDPSFKSGYRLLMQEAGVSAAGPADCNGTATRTGFYTTAAPVSLGTTGRRAFSSSSAGVIFVDASGTPPTEAAMLPGGGGEPIR